MDVGREMEKEVAQGPLSAADRRDVVHEKHRDAHVIILPQGREDGSNVRREGLEQRVEEVEGEGDDFALPGGGVEGVVRAVDRMEIEG